MPSQCAQLKTEYEQLKTLKAEFALEYAKVRESGDLREIKKLKKELEQARDALKEKLEEKVSAIVNTLERLLKDGAGKNNVALGLVGVNTPEAFKFRSRHFGSNLTLQARSFETGWDVINGVVCRYGYEE
ncbi:MAG: hypothetical protein AAB731_00695 [Patescibacteria group bacterium]